MNPRIYSAALQGLDAQLVEVEATLSSGLRSFLIVGLADTAVKEARERVHSAIKQAGLSFPRGRIAVNLAPADVKKQGTIYDLPIALSILHALGEIPTESLAGALFVGELALDGNVRAVNGALLFALGAKTAKLKRLFVPTENVQEALLVSGLEIFGVPSLPALIKHLRSEEALVPATKNPSVHHETKNAAEFDMMHVRGQEAAKRALEIAAAGNHNLLLSGPPGSGKTLLARTMPTILPSMTQNEALEVTKIYTASGMLAPQQGLIEERPFRSPHHTTSGVALVGGGANPRPGEVTLAHRGVLFLDEFPEFHRASLENLRQPLEDGVVTISRAAGTMRYPARFLLVAAMNPCPCGFASDPRHPCICSNIDLQRYRRKISGPLLDRIDLLIEVPKVDTEKLTSEEMGESSESIQTRVQEARDRQLARLKGTKLTCNSELSTRAAKEQSALSAEALSFVRNATETLGLSARAFTRVLKVARTIADLAGAARVDVVHLAEALQYRPKISLESH